MESTKLLIIGFGGHARSIADVALKAGHSQLTFLDPMARFQEHFFNFPVVKDIASFHGCCIAAAGDCSKRRQQFDLARASHWQMCSVISPHATQGLGVNLGEGSFIAHHAHIGPLAKIGQGCIINTGAIVEHDCDIGNFSHVSVRSVLAGGVTLGQDVFIGAGAVVKQSIYIGDAVTIGAGATVVHDIIEPGIYVGTPAKLLIR